MDCIKMIKCRNAIYPEKCKSCATGMLNFENINTPKWVNCDNCTNKNTMCWQCSVKNEWSNYLNFGINL